MPRPDEPLFMPNSPNRHVRTPADEARHRELRSWFDSKRPSLEDLLATGDYTPPMKLMDALSNTDAPSELHRWHRRYGIWVVIGGLVVVTLLVAAALFANYMYWRSKQQAQQRAAAKTVDQLGGKSQHIFSSMSPWARFFEAGDAPNLFMLPSKGLTDNDLVVFESAPTTRGLYLFDNRITDEGLTHLRNLPALDFLDLRRNPITDAGLRHLEQHKNLKHLYLIGTQVTPAGVQRLRAKLPNAEIAH